MDFDGGNRRTQLGNLLDTWTDRLAPKDAILASNSSSYPSRQIIERVTDPSRVCQYALLHAARADCRRSHVMRKERPML
jgi:hypothetical protein